MEIGEFGMEQPAFAVQFRHPEARPHRQRCHPREDGRPGIPLFLR